VGKQSAIRLDVWIEPDRDDASSAIVGHLRDPTDRNSASDGALLEIGVLDIDGDDSVVIHAMLLRPKFYRFLG